MLEHGGCSASLHKMPSCYVVTWNAIVWGHVKFGEGQKALELFQEMKRELCTLSLPLCGGAECICKHICK